MTRFVITPDVALHLADQGLRPAAGHRLLAPTLLRSQLLAQLYAEVQAGRRSEAQARAALEHLRRLNPRLLGDRVLQRVAWSMAAELGAPDTFQAEYLALARLQADALVTRHAPLAEAAARLRPAVPVAPMEALFAA